MTPPDAANGDLQGTLSAEAFGTKVRAQGPLVVLLLAIGGLGWITFTGFDRMMAFEVQARMLQVAEHAAIVASQNNLACVLLMSLRERESFTGDPGRACAYLEVRRTGPYRSP